MDALKKAKQLVQDAYYDERGMAAVMRQDAAIWAAIAQAEAAQPRLIRIGNDTINLAHVVHARIGERVGWNGEPELEVTIYLAAPSSGDVWLITPHSLWYTGERAEAVAPFVREVLQPMIVAEIDLPISTPVDQEAEVTDSAGAIVYLGDDF